MKIIKSPRHLCLQCQKHRALFRYKGKVKRDKEHTLCFRCFQSLVDACHARAIAYRHLSTIPFVESVTTTFLPQSLEIN